MKRVASKTSTAARRANRVVSVAQMELDNSEDPQYIATLTIPLDDLSGSKLLPFAIFCGFEIRNCSPCRSSTRPFRGGVDR